MQINDTDTMSSSHENINPATSSATNNNNNAITNDGSSNLISALLPPEVRDPRLFIAGQRERLGDIKYHWEDFNRRQRTWAHRGLLVLAVLQIIGAIAYDIVLVEVGDDIEFRRKTYMCVCMAIIELFQAHLIIIGTVLENTAMIMLASLNASAVVGRMILNLYEANHSVNMWWVVPAVITGILSAAVLSFSLVAASTFGRLVMFTVTSDPDMIALYRRYQVMQGFALLDLQGVLLTVTTAYFFEAFYAEWDIVLTTAAAVVGIVTNLSLVWHVRNEHVGRVLAFVFLSVGFGVYGVYACTKVFVPKVNEFRYSESLCYLALFSLLALRLVFFVTVWICVKGFGAGLKECLREQRVRPQSFIRNDDDAACFLREGEEPPVDTNSSTVFTTYTPPVVPAPDTVAQTANQE
eukprot:PhM_4_TR11082/c0_g1_i1/m.95219